MAAIPVKRKWGMLRCQTCERRMEILDRQRPEVFVNPNGAVAKFMPKILCRYVMGSLTTGGMIEVKCKACKSYSVVTFENQHGDGVHTFEWMQRLSS